jgi:hypothetical protein
MPNTIRLPACAAILLAWLGLTAAAMAQATVLDRPIRVITQNSSGDRVDAMVVSFDENGFEAIGPNRTSRRVAWADLPAAKVLQVHQRLLRDAPAGEWVELGAMLRLRPDGEVPAQQAFRQALRLDPSVAARIEQLEQTALPTPQPTSRPSGSPMMPQRGGDGSDPVAPPQPDQQGPSQDKGWPELNDEQMQQAIEELHLFADQASQTVGTPLTAYETDYFLFYTDIRPGEARRYLALLDNMYRRLAGLFDLPTDVNIFRGKALVLVFQQERDYQLFQRQVHGVDPGLSAGMCHGFGDGTVHIAFHRQPNELEFLHLLVHESVHGFLHRYRDRPHVPSWMNEGLAESVAAQLVANRGKHQQIQQLARDNLRRHQFSMGGMMSDLRIEAWQYPVAQTLAGYLLERDVRAFGEMINAVKDGRGWQEALRNSYGMDPAQLSEAYGEWMGFGPVTP